MSLSPQQHNITNMSFFKSYTPNIPSVSPTVIAAEQEMDAMTDIFNRLSRICHDRCLIPPYYDSVLTKGESVCTDRCVSKFFDVSYKVGQHLENRRRQSE